VQRQTRNGGESIADDFLVRHAASTGVRVNGRDLDRGDPLRPFSVLRG
jgi:hypothetical protein